MCTAMQVDCMWGFRMGGALLSLHTHTTMAVINCTNNTQEQKLFSASVLQYQLGSMCAMPCLSPWPVIQVLLVHGLLQAGESTSSVSSSASVITMNQGAFLYIFIHRGNSGQLVWPTTAVSLWQLQQRDGLPNTEPLSNQHSTRLIQNICYCKTAERHPPCAAASWSPSGNKLDHHPDAAH